jgi:hypothetical protein
VRQAVIDETTRATGQSANTSTLSATGDGANGCADTRATRHDRHGFAGRSAVMHMVRRSHPA